MALNDRFTKYYAEDATTATSYQELPKERQSSLANRRLVEELANRASVLEALRENKSIYESPGRKQGAAFGRGRSNLNFMGKQHNLSVFDRLGNIRKRYHNSTVHDRLGYVRGRNYNLSVHDRLGYNYNGRRGRRNFKSGVSPLNRDEFEFQESGFEKKWQTEFRRRDDFQANRRSSCGNIYVKVHSNRFQHKADMDGMRIEVANRADPAGIFYFHNGIRYYKSEIFIWVTEWNPFE